MKWSVDEALLQHRRNFRPTKRNPRPRATICVWALAAETESEARRLLTAREHWRIGFEQGLREPLVSPDQAAAQAYTDAERVVIEHVLAGATVGTA